MKLNQDEFSELCAEVISDLVADEELKGEGKIVLLLTGTMIADKIKSKLFSDDEEIEIVSNGSGREDK